MTKGPSGINCVAATVKTAETTQSFDERRFAYFLPSPKSQLAVVCGLTGNFQ